MKISGFCTLRDSFTININFGILNTPTLKRLQHLADRIHHTFHLYF